MGIEELLAATVSRKASDLHLVPGFEVTWRVDGNLITSPAHGLLTKDDVANLILATLIPAQKETLFANKELDYSYQYTDLGRFRVNVYFQKGAIAANFRFLPLIIPTIDDLKLPAVCHRFATLRQGFILVTGPTGHGKSTTIAAILNEINLTRPVHIITIEDPIEYLYPRGKAVVSQREMHGDTFSWPAAIRSALRQDPDVVLIGEMRDYETISAALTVAETGHLVFATLHTNDAAQTVDRVVDVFPEAQQAQARLQLGNVLEAILSLRLVPRIRGGRIPAAEIMLATPAIRNSIREGKSHLINNTIQTSAEIGMMLLERSLADWVKKGEISLEAAQEYSLHPEEVAKLARGLK